MAGTGLSADADVLQFRALDAAGQQLLASAYSQIYRSEDGGASWTVATPSGGNGMNGVFVQGSRVYAQWSGSLHYSDDQGRSWKDLKLPDGFSTGNSYGLTLTAAGAGLLLNDPVRGVFASLDQGNTWRQLREADNSLQGRAHTVAFRDAKNGLMVNSKGELLASADAGKTWSLKRADLGTGGYYSFLARLQYVNARTAFLLAPNRQIYKSIDGGESWSSGLNSSTWTAFRFSDELQGWASNDSGIMALSHDGGQTWVTLPQPSFQVADLRIGSDGLVTAVGAAGGIAQSKDDGKTWQLRYSGARESLRRLYSLDGKTFWALGIPGTVLKSEDGGISWSRVAVPAQAILNDIQFSDARNGWIVGEAGTVLATRDGGKSWSAQDSASAKSLQSVQMLDSRTGWIVGAEGSLLATGTGGF